MEIARIAGVVVLFQPSEFVAHCIESYRPEVGVLYVFDNSPGESVRLVTTIRQLKKIKYLTSGKNVGMASALNAAARSAIKDGYEYLLTMDQDGLASKQMIDILMYHIVSDPSIALITPVHLDRHTPSTERSSSNIDFVTTAMTSGNIIRLSAYAKVGGFLDKLFIDYVDVEYCMRLRLNGLSVGRANQAILSHAVGNYSTRRLLWRTVYPANHSTMRYFYQTRNRFYLRRLYGNTFPEYFAEDLQKFLASGVKMLLYETQRFKKLKMIIGGLWAFWKNDFDALPSS